MHDREKRIWDWLASRGNAAYTVSLYHVSAPGNTSGTPNLKTSDFIVDNVPTEAKNASTANAMQNRAKGGRHQSRNLLYDTRGSGISRAEAENGVKNIVEKYGDGLDRVTVISDGFTLRWERD